MPTQFIVAEEDIGNRIDKYLAGVLEVARNQIQNAISEKQVIVNGKPAKASYRVEMDDKIEVLREITDPTILPPLEPRPDLKLTILHEDDDIIVVEKPSGMLMHPARASDDATLVNALIAHYPEIAKVGESEWRPGVMQRLDKEASGLVVIGRNQKAYDHLKNQFKNHEILKEYDVLIEGDIFKDEGTINLPIGRAKGSGKMTAHTQAAEKDKPAVTHYKVEERLPKSTRLTVRTETGRTHQIRVHLRSLGHPLVGDSIYGRKDGLNAKRLCLHAKKLGFKHPKDNKFIEFESPAPEWKVGNK